MKTKWFKNKGKSKMFKTFLVICLTVGVSYVESACQYHNPLFNTTTPDPWFTFHDGFYYYSRKTGIHSMINCLIYKFYYYYY